MGGEWGLGGGEEHPRLPWAELEGGPQAWWSHPHILPRLPLPSRVREQLQSVQVQWTRVQEKSEQKRRQLLASLQFQVRGQPRYMRPPLDECLSVHCCTNNCAPCGALSSLQSSFPPVMPWTLSISLTGIMALVFQMRKTEAEATLLRGGAGTEVLTNPPRPPSSG